MKRLFITAIIAIMAVNFGLYAQEKDIVQSELLPQQIGKVELKVVYEKTFDEPIVDAVFDTATVSIEAAKRLGWKEEALKPKEGLDSRVTILYPKCLFISDGRQLSYDPLDNAKKIREIAFLKQNGELVNKEFVRAESERVTYSENGKYILRTWVADEDYTERRGGILYDADGEVLWRKDENLPVAVSGEGFVISVYPPTHAEVLSKRHIFYDASGKEITAIVNPLKDKPAGYSAAKFSPSGNYAVLGYTDFDKTMIILADVEGHILWQREFGWRSYAPYEMDIADDFGMIGVCVDDKGNTYVFFVNWQGDLVWRIPLEIKGNMIVKVSEDKKKVYVASSSGYIWCIDTNGGKFLWKHEEKWATDPSFTEKRLSWEVPRFREMKTIDNALYIIGKQGRDWHSSILFVFHGESGVLMEEIEYPQGKITFAQTQKEIGLINITKRKVFIRMVIE